MSGNEAEGRRHATISPMAWNPMNVNEYHQKLQALPADQKDLLDGWSPGHVAARLGITRSAVHQAVRRNKMTGYRLTRNGKLVAIIIPERSIREYENSETRAKFTPRQYRTA